MKPSLNPLCTVIKPFGSARDLALPVQTFSIGLVVAYGEAPNEKEISQCRVRWQIHRGCSVQGRLASSTG